MLAVRRRGKMIHAPDCSNDNTATPTAIAAIRSSAWHIPLATKAQAPVASTARPNPDLHPTDEHDDSN